MIASLSVPWGDEQSDDARGGYHSDKRVKNVERNQ
jgi:hypothetical protein